MVRKLQFWLSQRTDIPVLLLSGMAVPDVAGWAAHRVVESQVVLLFALLGVVEGEPPPPQLANSVVRVSKKLVQSVDRIQGSTQWGLPIPSQGFKLGAGKPVCRDCLRFA
jgi:hypothetical protein